ncbi:acyl-protein thioesterase [Clonorchis sinensis]|uniref:palmitoyl-protein hydrolase n=1 Tax=Clonorchis sinensis TaxID=79923 RepID=A0A8T1M861_CLOSI|nr:acyl-protein thioesterase [Clonorchis sinensis]
MGNSVDGAMSAAKLLPAVVIASKTAPTATFIFLHGLGDDGRGWSSVLREIVPDYCKLICPNAPVISVTLNGGMRMPAWYDIHGLTPDSRQDEAGILEANDELEKFVQAEIKAGIPANRIVIGGFSQGGSVALYNAVTKGHPYAGVVALSCWLPLHSKLVSDQSLINGHRETPIFQCHGREDCLVSHHMGSATHDLLKTFRMTKCEFTSYANLGHSSSDEELNDVQCFLKKTLPAL